MIENKDFVVCKVCNNHFKVLSGHIKDAHGIPSIKEYLKLYPNSVTICSESSLRNKIHKEKTCIEIYGVSNAMKVPSIAEKCYKSGCNKRMLKYGVKDSSQIPGVAKKIAEKRVNKWINKFGVPYHPVARKESVRKAQETIAKDYNVINMSQIEGVLDKKHQTWIKNYGVSNPMKYTEIMLKCFKSSNKSPNSVERKVIELNIENVLFTGDGKIVIQAEKKKKIPDFIISPFLSTRKVIEIFGEFYHGKQVTKEDPEIHERNIKQLYFNIGIDCLIIWSMELKNLQRVTEKIQKFISTKNTLRDYTPNILYKDEDIVQYI